MTFARAKELATKGFALRGCGHKRRRVGGFGARAICQMIGGEKQVVEHLESDPSKRSRQGVVIFLAHRGGRESRERPKKAICTAALREPATSLKMVHNGIEYALMAAYAEGLNILKHANAGSGTPRSGCRKQRRYAIRRTTAMTFLWADVTEVWRRGSVVASWLLDLTAISLLEQPSLERFSGKGIGFRGGTLDDPCSHRIDGGRAPVLTASLFQALCLARGKTIFAAKLLSAMRFSVWRAPGRSPRPPSEWAWDRR